MHRAEATANEALPSLDEMRARLAVLDRRKASLGEELARLKHAKEVSAQQLSSLTQQMTALKQAAANLTANHAAQVPRVRCVGFPGMVATMAPLGCFHVASLGRATTSSRQHDPRPSSSPAGTP